MGRFNIFALFALAVLSAGGCAGSHRIGLWEGYTDVFDANGRVEDYRIRKGRPFVVTLLMTREFSDVLFHTPKGKIDRIIEENPEWEFVFYCKGAPGDSSKVMDVLSRYGCRFPVIMDPEGRWERENIDGKYSAIGVICDAEGNMLGMSVIGTSQSFFDSEFAKAKRALGL